MRDLEKSNEVKMYLQTIRDTVECYENDAHPIYFYYEGVIELLRQAETIINESARCPRPENLSPDIPWSERLFDGDDVFDPYVFDGTMSEEDYKRMHELMAADMERDDAKLEIDEKPTAPDKSETKDIATRLAEGKAVAAAHQGASAAKKQQEEIS